MKQSDAFPSRFMNKDDVKKQIVLHISRADMENVGTESNQEEKPCLFFEEPEAKPMVLNNINWETIAELYGEESDDWHGKPIELFVDPTVKFGGKRVGGIRVRKPRTEPAQNANPSF